MIIEEARLKSLFDLSKDKMPFFKRNTYEQAFRKYYGECLPVYDEIENILKDKDETEKADTISEIVQDFVSIFKKEYELIYKKGAKKNYVTNHNSPLVVFTFPGILEYNAGWSKPLCDNLVKYWNDAFKSMTIGYGTYADINGGFKTKLCYITTAICLSLSKEDDCEELNLLRDYRDNILLNEDGGKELIDEYYNIAPTIVKRINKSENPDRTYVRLYESYIKKCIGFIKEKQFDMCKNTYINMVKELKAQYAG